MNKQAVDILDEKLAEHYATQKVGFEKFVDKYELGWLVCPYLGHDYLSVESMTPTYSISTGKQMGFTPVTIKQCKRAGCGHRNMGSIQRFLDTYKPHTNLKKFLDDWSYYIFLR